MPSTPTIKISIDGDDQFARAFDRYDAAFSDLTNIWPDVKKKFHEIEKEQFDSEGSAGGDRWQPLSERYAAQKIKQYGSKPILQASGDLYRSLTGDGPYTHYQTNKTQIEIGTTLPYGLYHQRGGGKLPKRPPINFSDRQKNELMKVIQSGLIRELRRGSGYVIPQDRSR